MYLQRRLREKRLVTVSLNIYFPFLTLTVSLFCSSQSKWKQEMISIQSKMLKVTCPGHQKLVAQYQNYSLFFQTLGISLIPLK